MFVFHISLLCFFITTMTIIVISLLLSMGARWCTSTWSLRHIRTEPESSFRFQGQEFSYPTIWGWGHWQSRYAWGLDFPLTCRGKLERLFQGVAPFGRMRSHGSEIHDFHTSWIFVGGGTDSKLLWSSWLSGKIQTHLSTLTPLIPAQRKNNVCRPYVIFFRVFLVGEYIYLSWVGWWLVDFPGINNKLQFMA